jgi:hypothetical protein
MNKDAVKNVLSLRGVTIIFVASIAIIAFTATYYVKVFYSRPEAPPAPPVVEVGEDVKLEEEPASTTTPRVVREPDIHDMTPEIDEIPSGEIQVNWYAKPIELSDNQIRTLLTNAASDKERMEEILNELKEREDEDYFHYKIDGFWEHGRVRGGEYNRATVYTFKTTEQGMGIFQTILHVLQPVGTNELYAVHTREYGSDQSIYMDVRFLPNIKIQDLDIPETITLTNGRELFKQTRSFNRAQFLKFEESDEKKSRIATTVDGRTVYQLSTDVRVPDGDNIYDNGCLVVYAVDGTEHTYAPQIPGELLEERYSGESVPNIDWTVGYENEEPFMDKLYGGCGPYSCLNIVPEEIVYGYGDTEVAGKTSEGDEVLVLKDPFRHPLVYELYDGWHVISDDKKPSTEEFLERYPVPLFFWKDTFGRWVVHRATTILPLAECGKPVIYLYPEETTDVQVRLPEFIDVTVSDPEYPEDGWKVTAHPSGQLDYCDGNTYGSLYWEGNGAVYEPPTTGFVVEDGEVDLFLRVALAKYGLNETESREFREFWLPEMTGAPFYRVSFVVEDWNKAAPLYVTPRPDTAIRIFMDWEKLQAPISIDPPEIVTPEREGFTLVEWGGLLYE